MQQNHSNEWTWKFRTSNFISSLEFRYRTRSVRSLLSSTVPLSNIVPQKLVLSDIVRTLQKLKEIQAVAYNRGYTVNVLMDNLVGCYEFMYPRTLLLYGSQLNKKNQVWIISKTNYIVVPSDEGRQFLIRLVNFIFVTNNDKIVSFLS